MKKLAFLILFFLIGCKSEPKDLLVVDEKETDEFLHLETIQNLQFKSDSLFYDEFEIGNFSNNENYKKQSKYRIKNDTIYLEQPFCRSKKAIVKNGYLDFIESYPSFKIKISENKLVKDLNPNLCKSNDFTYFTSYGLMKKFSFTDNGIKGKDSNLNCNEVQQVRNLLQQTIDENKGKFGNHTNQKDYFKCCYIIETAEGEKIVYLRAYAELKDEIYRQTLVEVKASEKASLVHLYLNLTKNTYSHLATTL